MLLFFSLRQSIQNERCNYTHQIMHDMANNLGVLMMFNLMIMLNITFLQYGMQPQYNYSMAFIINNCSYTSNISLAPKKSIFLDQGNPSMYGGVSRYIWACLISCIHDYVTKGFFPQLSYIAIEKTPGHSKMAKQTVELLLKSWSSIYTESSCSLHAVGYHFPIHFIT